MLNFDFRTILLLPLYVYFYSVKEYFTYDLNRILFVKGILFRMNIKSIVKKVNYQSISVLISKKKMEYLYISKI